MPREHGTRGELEQGSGAALDTTAAAYASGGFCSPQRWRTTPATPAGASKRLPGCAKGLEANQVRVASLSSRRIAVAEPLKPDNSVRATRWTAS
jgi:hypothetical protein